MKIKQTKTMKLPELIEWSWHNDVDGLYDAINKNDVRVNIQGGKVATCCGKLLPSMDTIFRVEKVEEIDEESTLNLISVDYLDEITQESHRTINEVVQDFEDVGDTLKYIYLQREDGRIGQLLWENGKLVEESVE